MRSLGSILVAFAIVASTAAVLWTFRIEILSQSDGTTFRHNRVTGEMQLCDARRCIDASAKRRPAAENAEDKLFEQLLEETSVSLLQELKEKSALRRSNKDGIAKGFDLAFSVGAGALKPIFAVENLLLGEPPLESKSRFRVAAEHRLIELERQSFWNTVAGTSGSMISGAVIASILFVFAWKLLTAFGFMRSSERDKTRVSELPSAPSNKEPATPI